MRYVVQIQGTIEVEAEDEDAALHEAEMACEGVTASVVGEKWDLFIELTEADEVHPAAEEIE